MSISEQLAQSYHQDARRMIAGARAALEKAPISIDSLLNEIHTLKGTSTMVPHPAAQSCVGVLHLIEIKVTERPEEPDSWAGLVREVLNLCEKEISKIGENLSDSAVSDVKASSQAPAQVATPASALISLKGVLARVIFKGQSCLGELLWFPLNEVSDVQLWKGCREFERSQGQTLPLLGTTELAWEHTALTFQVKTEEGSLTLLVKEVVGLVSWKTALQHSALSGVPFILEQWKEICESNAVNQSYRLQKIMSTLSVAAAS